VTPLSSSNPYKHLKLKQSEVLAAIIKLRFSKDCLSKRKVNKMKAVVVYESLWGAELVKVMIWWVGHLPCNGKTWESITASQRDLT